MRFLGFTCFAAVLLAAPGVRAQGAPPGPRADDEFDFMNLLAYHGLHDIKHERWNAYGQVTYISNWKRPFSAPYTNLGGTTNSLLPDAERSYTGTATVYLGLGLWRGAEAYLVPEVIMERPLSGLTGLGGAIQNFELQKNGSESPTLYVSRAFFKQTIEFGGGEVEKTSDPMQLGSVVDRRRLALSVGNFSILDFFDRNSVLVDLRRTFLNMSFLTYAAYDFAADARGYAWGGVAEYFHDDWALRIARITPPKDPNQLPLDFRLDRYYGDQVEIEHSHEIHGRAGTVRLLGYRNRERMGRFGDALAAYRADPSRNATTCPEGKFNYGNGNANAPDLCWAREPNVKIGLGLSVEQRISDDLGVFFRGMISDGETEVYSYTSADRSVSFGGVAKGSAWRRRLDLAGVGFSMDWISRAHAEFLHAGGVDGFVGDGRIRWTPERVIEAFYSFSILSSLWLSADYQHVSNPGFNADRGPVDIFSGRVHAEF